MDDNLKKQLESLINTSKINGRMIGIVTQMKKDKFTDVEMIAVGILISKMAKQKMGGTK